MKESILKALLQLFAIIANVDKHEISGPAKKIVESYLRQHLSRNQLTPYLEQFDQYLALHHKGLRDRESMASRKKRSSDSVKVLLICEQINEGLQQEEKILVILRLIELVNEDHIITPKEFDFLKTVADTFNIPEGEYCDIKALALEKEIGNIRKERILIVDGEDSQKYPGIHHLKRENLEGRIVFLLEGSNTLLFKYQGEKELVRNAQEVVPDRIYIMDSGSVIRSNRIVPVYYGDVAGKFMQPASQAELTFIAEQIEFRFRNSENGIHPFNFAARAGQLIGIMGGSGTGKSTLLNLLNGTLKPRNGRILINSNDLHSEENNLEGVIGYVPQDDLLIEELTVFQNLYFNARLCFSDYPERKVLKTVVKVLRDLDLSEIKHLTVGNPLNKTISGGQRKRLNIGLELMREPSVLFVDEPTSGLSSMDSEMVMLLLKEQTLKGKLVIVNIHQPSSFVYKLFDRLIILDRGGYPIYQGNPTDAVVYFRKMSSHVNADESECITCGNVNPEQVLQLVETKFVNQYGKYTGTRRVTPGEWYQLYREHIENKKKIRQSRSPIPESPFRIPGKFSQFRIFSLRNLLSKLSNTQYLLVNFLEAPLLAVIIGYFTKYISGTLADPDTYVFMENDNLPAYLFMSVVVALFIGMTVSAEEIIRDARILQRETFLHLSRFSYINSKILILFVISAIQTISFVLLGNLILEIRDMTLLYWLVLFTTACMANLIGLNISSAFNSVVTIYILIPLILVPQLLFSGAIVPFDKLHKKITSSVYVPVIGDMMTSRWAYEALAVSQFKKNSFQEHFFDAEQKMSDASWYASFLIPRLITIVGNTENLLEKEADNNRLARNLDILKNELERLGEQPEVPYLFSPGTWHTDSISLEFTGFARQYLEEALDIFSAKYEEASRERDRIYDRLSGRLGSAEAVLELRNTCHNRALADMLLNRNLVNKIVETRTRLVRKKDPVYTKPESRAGRAHLYAPVKRLGNMMIDTCWFNLCFIWITILLFYVILYYNLLRKLVDYIEGFRLRRR